MTSKPWLAQLHKKVSVIMNSYKAERYNRKILRFLAPAFILMFVLIQMKVLRGGVWLGLLNIGQLTISLSIIFLPPKWWTRSRIFAATILAFAIVVASMLINNNQFSIYALFLLIAFSSRYLKYPLYLYYSLLVCVAIIILFVVFGHRDFLQLVSISLLVVGFMLSVQARRNRQEAYELSMQHLEELQRAHTELQESAVTSMQFAVLGERTRIAREIHDSVGHSLTSIIVQLQALRYMLEADPDKAKASVEDLLAVAKQGLADIRTSVYALAEDKSALGIAPLKALLSQVEKTTSLRCRFTCAAEAHDLPVQEATVLFKVLQEAVTNILKYANASEIDVKVSSTAETIKMVIRDNGRFKREDRLAEGFGLRSMRERVAEIGGSILLQPLDPQGLEITAAIPNPSELDLEARSYGAT